MYIYIYICIYRGKYTDLLYISFDDPGSSFSVAGSRTYAPTIIKKMPSDAISNGSNKIGMSSPHDLVKPMGLALDLNNCSASVQPCRCSAKITKPSTWMHAKQQNLGIDRKNVDRQSANAATFSHVAMFTVPSETLFMKTHVFNFRLSTL